MQTGYLGLIGALLLVVGSGCAEDTTPEGAGGTAVVPMGGGDQSVGGAAGGADNTGGMPVGNGGNPPAGGGGAGGTPEPVMCDANAVGCGGDVVGTWNVAGSCLTINGDMDVFLTSLACATVPATGQLETSGTLTLNADGTYTDNTVTTGSVNFPLDASCLAISGVPVECDRVGSIFASVGWMSGTCTPTADGGCDCAMTTEQQGGLGNILPFTESSGDYSVTPETLTISESNYSYCQNGGSLTLIPQMDALSGSVVLQGEGNPNPNVGGAGGEGGEGGAGGMAGGAGGEGGAPPVGSPGPCDIYEEAGTPCVAAHSTVRALFASYDGPLYEVKRQDGMYQDIPLKSPGGFADSAQQDAFCGASSCVIWRLYDQSENGNFLMAQTPDSDVGGFQGQSAADADQEKVVVGGNEVYSLFTRPRQAYWNDGSETGMPLGAAPQSVYMVTSGTHFNSGCCYNYGNAQLDRNYHGGPTMDSVYFGNNTIWDTGAGSGPWVMADMEDGMTSWAPRGMNPNSPSLPFDFVTAMEKNNGTTQFALKGGDATQPDLTVMWDGELPAGKNPMKKEGAVILGAGGDCCFSNNNASEGTFYEGAIVAGYPDDEVDIAIHQNIVEAGYTKP